MIPALLSLLVAAPPALPPADATATDECGAAVLLKWGEDARRLRGRPGTAEELLALSRACDDAGRRHNIDPDFLRAMAWVESRGNPRARSKAGARGPFQIMLLTARPVLPPEVTRADVLNTLHSADRSAIVAALVLRRMVKRWGRRALTVYTCGVGPRCRDDAGRLFRRTRAARAYHREWQKMQREAAACRRNHQRRTPTP